MSKDSSRDLLVVGSGLEAHLALARLAPVEFSGTVHHLPTETVSHRVECTSAPEFAGQGTAAPGTARLRDVWGNTVLSFSLPALRLVEPPAQALPRGVAALAHGLTVSRTSLGEQGVTVTFSDGSDLLCQGVLFGDGVGSQCHAFWDKPVPHKKDPHATRCWSFLTSNLLNIETWEFRWAAAKSVEILPLDENRLSVKLRFKSPFGGKLAVTELRDLFSEFGSDMTALFENVSDGAVEVWEETSLARSVFAPAGGCVALGRAAWGSMPLLTFDWLSRFTEIQLDIVAEQVETGKLSPESFEAQSRERLSRLEESELFLRRHLHSDNALLRPLRNALLKLLPKPFLAAQVKKRLYLGAQAPSSD